MKVLLILLGVVVLPLLMIVLFLWLFYRRRNKKSAETQHIITDREILRLIQAQPDRMISTDQLANATELTKSQAKARLFLLGDFGVLKGHYGNNFKGYFSLSEPIDERPAPALSPEPFLTVEDILTLFKFFNFRLTPQQLVMATGLPVTILKREMKYFQKQKILQTLVQTNPSGVVGSQSFVLMEPYRSNPERFLEQQLDMNRQMETILRKEDLV